MIQLRHSWFASREPRVRELGKAFTTEGTEQSVKEELRSAPIFVS